MIKMLSSKIINRLLFFMCLVFFLHCYQKPTPGEKEEVCVREYLIQLGIANFSQEMSAAYLADCLHKKNLTKGKTLFEYDGGRFVY